MKTVTSPGGSTHQIRASSTTYRGVASPTITWCGIRAPRDWVTTRTTPPTCRVCAARHAAANA